MSDFQIDQPFQLPVEYNGRETLLSGTLKRRGYGYKIHMDVDGHEIVFEPDEERNFRAIIENYDHRISTGLIGAIGAALEKHLR